MYEIANIDKFGRIVLPKKMRSILSLGESSTVFIEDKDHELVVKLVHKKTGNTAKKIATMELPVGDWESMEAEDSSASCPPEHLFALY